MGLEVTCERGTARISAEREGQRFGEETLAEMSAWELGRDTAGHSKEPGAWELEKGFRHSPTTTSLSLPTSLLGNPDQGLHLQKVSQKKMPKERTRKPFPTILLLLYFLKDNHPKPCEEGTHL